MATKYETLAKLQKLRVVAVIRGKSSQEAIEVSRAAIAGGLKAIELTYTTPDVADAFRALREEDCLVGAGTVLDSETARHAILHGAQFVVSPQFSPEISVVCNRYAIPYLPGCLTIKEMVEAAECGHDVIKLFPANNFTPSFIGAVNGPLPQLQIMPTGGVNLTSARSWLDAGAFAVGVGSDLTKAYRSGGAEAVTALAKEYMAATSKESE